MALYNTTYYNADQYNLTADLLALSDSIAPTDATITTSVGLIRQDSTSGVDTVGRNIGPDIDDMIALTELRIATISLLRNDSAVLTEELTHILQLAALLETVSVTDTLVSTQEATYFDLVFVEDPNFTIEISNKALSDSLRLADWLNIERSPQVDGWGD